MKKSDTEKKIYLDSRFYYCLVTAVFVFFTIFCAVYNKNYSISDITSKNFESGWEYANGTPVDFNNLDSDASYTIYKTIDKGSINNKSLCFYSKNVYFTVFLDGKAIYDFHPINTRLLGKSYAVYPHAITLPVLYESSTLSVSIDNLYEKTPGYINDLSLGNGNYFIISKMQETAPEFLICTVIFAIGSVAFILGAVGKYFGDRRYEIISLGVFAMVSGLWIATENPFFSLLMSAPIAIQFVDYMMLIILPLPTVLFASFVTGNKENKIGMVVGLLSAINLLTQILFTSLKIKDYHELLIISHILLGLTVLVTIYLFIKSIIQKRISNGFLIILALTFFFPLLVGVFELVRYQLQPGAYIGTHFYQYIIFVFIFLCCIYEILSISEMSRKGQYAEIMEKMAYTDALTDLNNREAYNQFIENNMEEGGHYTFVMLDMNNLKGVNDQFGHAVGDEYIKALAKSLKESFTENCTCFRMGGDEFLVITTLTSVDIKFLDTLDLFYTKINEFNEKKKYEIPLTVAVGYSDYSVGNSSVKEAMREADIKMYERKKKMKEK